MTELAAVRIAAIAGDAEVRGLDAIYYIDDAGESTDVTAADRAVEELLDLFDWARTFEPTERSCGRVKA